MDPISLMVIATALAMDAFSVCISSGMVIKKPGFRHYFRLSFHFGLFQFIMPVIGFFGGRYLESYIKAYDHWIAFGLLVLIGLKMIGESFSPKSEAEEPRDPSRGLNLIILSVATSIDAMAVGISIGVLNRPIIFPSIIIGLVCAAFSILGIAIGNKVGSLFGRRAEALGGVMLIAIGIKILADHLIN
jgi:manganese efflux pump family protein